MKFQLCKKKTHQKYENNKIVEVHRTLSYKIFLQKFYKKLPKRQQQGITSFLEFSEIIFRFFEKLKFFFSKKLVRKKQMLHAT